MIYKINENYEGAVMIGDRSYRPSQIIRDDGTSPKLTRAIEKLLKLEDCPISLVEEKQEEGHATVEPAPVTTDTPPANPSRQKEKDK